MSGRGQAAVFAVVQARMSSRRLPGKVLADLGGKSTLEMVTARLGSATELAGTVLATSVETSDDAIERAARDLDCQLHRGPLDDVLGRFSEVLQRTGADAVVRVTADCPFVDPGIVDELVRIWRTGSADYVSNVVDPLSFPKGLNAEVVAAQALEAAASAATAPADREHVTTFIRARPERFPSSGLWLDPPLPGAVVTLDTEGDLKRLRTLVSRVGHDPSLPSLLDALGASAPPRFRLSPPAG